MADAAPAVLTLVSGGQTGVDRGPLDVAMARGPVLNVAGPRESESPGIYQSARAYLRAALP